MNTGPSVRTQDDSINRGRACYLLVLSFLSDYKRETSAVGIWACGGGGGWDEIAVEHENTSGDAGYVLYIDSV